VFKGQALSDVIKDKQILENRKLYIGVKDEGTQAG